jgi:carboxyl-terminal processing protease
MKFTEDNRETMSKLKDLPSLDKWLSGQDLLSKFVAFAGQNGIPPRRDQIAVSQKIILVQLKAYIARNMLDNKGFYPVWQEIDKTLLDALSHLESN